MVEKQGKIELEIVTPAKLLFSERTDLVVIPGGEGDFGVLTGHAPLLSQVRPGTIDIYEGDKVSVQIFVEGGFVDVTAKRCTVLAEEAIMVVDIDKTSAHERLKKAQAAQDSDKNHVEGLDMPEVVAAEAQVMAVQN
jgi:F-type H+-transporting ATPase subunit epsilon